MLKLQYNLGNGSIPGPVVSIYLKLLGNWLLLTKFKQERLK